MVAVSFTRYLHFGCVFASFLLSDVLAASIDKRFHERSVFERRSSTLTPGWARSNRLSPDTVLPLRIGLAQQNLDKLETELLAVSHPESPDYGKHWTPEEIVEFFKPKEESVQLVREWLTASGLEDGRHRLSKAGNWIEAQITVKEAEELLEATYHSYEHVSGTKHIACESYTLPDHLHDHVEIILPSVHFDARVSRRSDDTRSPSIAHQIGQPSSGTGPKTTGTVSSIYQNLEACDEQITPDCLRALYNIVYKPLETSKNSFAVVEYTPQAYLASDLDMFFSNFSKSQVGIRPKLVSIDGGTVQTEYQSFGYNGESSLDLQYAFSLTDPQPITLYQVGDLVEGASFNNFLDALDASYCTSGGGDNPEFDAIYPDPYGGYQKQDCGITKPANVISTSYGMNEADVTPAYAIRQCNEYGKLGLAGVTVLYSSGDDGVAGNGDICLDPDGEEDFFGTVFNPTFPGVCPYVTSVGATQVKDNTNITSPLPPSPEQACDIVIFSGGGFSNVFSTPSWQKSAVSTYLKKFAPELGYAAGTFNASGNSRGFPDVSANGANYVIAVDGEFSLVYGTSASSPVFGSVITLINDARIAIGKPPVGFINPTIYSDVFKLLFNDITSGNNPGCDTNGFTAVEGWDPVTGLGTPDTVLLMAAWLLL